MVKKNTRARKPKAQTTDRATSQPKGGLLKKMQLVQRQARRRKPGRPTANQAEQIRERLVHAALHSFIQRGYEAASIEAIARDAKIAKITIYRQFGDKERLFREVVHYAQTRVKLNMEAVMKEDGEPEKVLRNVIGSILDSSTQPENLAVLRMVIAEAPRFPDIARAMLSETDYAFSPLIEYLRRLEEEGAIVVESPRDAAIQLGGLAIGGTRYLMRRPSRTPEARGHWINSVYTLFARAWGLQPLPKMKVES